VFVVIWQFTVKSEHLAAFERVYGSGGDWARLFRGCPGFVQTELLRDAEAPNQFATLDYWRTPDDYVRGMASLAPAYQELDQRCAGWTLEERRVGNFVKL
jgi:heme-degrading monooxygenase HmoA